LVYDLGGGTFDVSIVAIKGDSFKVKAVSGDTHLGGEDFDQKILEYCIDEFKKGAGIDISNNTRALRRLRIYCEKAKRTLAAAPEADIELDALADGEDFSLTLTRAKFDELCKESFNATIPCVDAALKDAGMTKKDIHEVIMVGGSTRILKI
jgi:L1 cell adhesion molecule like protein